MARARGDRSRGTPAPARDRAGSGRAADRHLDALTLGLFAVAFGTNVPTPLLLVYRETLDLSTASVTAVFGAYALGLVPALLLGGPASDRRGRRTVALPFVATAALTSLLFVPAADSVALLYLARFLQGVVSGVVFTVASAWLQELAGADRPQTAAVRTTLAMTGGFSLGPLSSGLLAEWGPAPTTLPYLVHVALVAVGLVVLRRVPETVTAPRAASTGTRPRGLALPPEARRPFWTVLAPMAVGVYAFPTVAITLLPLLLAEGGLTVAATGGLAGLTLGTGTAIAPLGRRLGPVAGPLGTALGAAGLAVGLAAVATTTPLLLLPTALLLGAGQGLVLTAGLALTARLAPPQTRGAVNSAFYAFAYSGFAAPFLLAALGDRVGDLPALAGATAVFAAVAAWLAVDHARRGGRTTP